jgi:ribosomal protein S18 acetylase RimI-like enzyme
MEPDRTSSGVRVRRLEAVDLDAVIALDHKVTGRRRDEYYRLKLAQALSGSGIRVSLVAELDGLFAGFLLSRVDYGEFGVFEPVAVLDTIAVAPDFGGRGVAQALFDQLRTNLLGLNIQELETEVAWDDQDLLSFFHHVGFRPSPRICLALDLSATARRAELQEVESAAGTGP